MLGLKSRHSKCVIPIYVQSPKSRTHFKAHLRLDQPPEFLLFSSPSSFSLPFIHGKIIHSGNQIIPWQIDSHDTVPLLPSCLHIFTLQHLISLYFTLLFVVILPRRHRYPCHPCTSHLALPVTMLLPSSTPCFPVGAENGIYCSHRTQSTQSMRISENGKRAAHTFFLRCACSCSLRTLEEACGLGSFYI